MDTSLSEESFPPQRHGCLTAWLVFTLVLGPVGIIVTPLMYPITKLAHPNYSPLIAAVLVACSVGRIVFTVALLKWRRWGFYGIVCVDLVAFVSNLIVGIGFGLSLLGLIGLAVLYALLNFGAHKAWNYLH